MFTVTLWTFSKKVDSTAQPSVTGTDFSCNILTPADITAPLVEITASADLTAYNYAYISNFHRYYWIEGISFDKGIWILSLAVDVLATYKTQIGAQSLYVLRSASAYDGDIQDNYYPILNDIVQTRQTDPHFAYDETASRYILNIAGTDTSGASTLWQLTPTNFRKLIAQLYEAIDGFQLTDVVKSVVKKFGGNPVNLINGAMWIPQAIVPAQVSDETVVIGSWYNAINPVKGKKVTTLAVDLPVIEFDIDAHPQVSKGRYLNLAPYSNYILYLPGIGQLPLDTSKLEGVDYISVLRTVDPLTGKCVYRVFTHPMTGNTNPPCQLFIGDCQWGVPISLGGNNASDGVLSSVGGAVASIGAAVASGGTTAIIGAVTGGIGTTLNAMGGSGASSSTGGNIGMHYYPAELDTTFYKITSWDDSHNGRPLMQLKTISSLSGFIMVQKGDVPIPGTSAEAERIKAFLEGGFFYE